MVRPVFEDSPVYADDPELLYPPDLTILIPEFPADTPANRALRYLGVVKVVKLRRDIGFVTGDNNVLLHPNQQDPGKYTRPLSVIYDAEVNGQIAGGSYRRALESVIERLPEYLDLAQLPEPRQSDD